MNIIVLLLFLSLKLTPLQNFSTTYLLLGESMMNVIFLASVHSPPSGWCINYKLENGEIFTLLVNVLIYALRSINQHTNHYYAQNIYFHLFM